MTFKIFLNNRFVACAVVLLLSFQVFMSANAQDGIVKGKSNGSSGAVRVPAGKVSGRGASANWNFSIESMPSWISSPPTIDAGAFSYSPGYIRELSDHQVKLDAEGEAHFVRQRLRINDVTGLETASQVNVSFSPDVKRLSFHEISIIRGNQRINMLDRTKVRWLQRETALEEQMIDGEVTASLILEDLRVGDIVEYAYTLRGANPVFGGRYSTLVPTTHPRPTVLFQYRLIAPESRRFVVAPNDNFQVVQMTRAGQQEITVQRRLVESKVREPFSPRISEYDMAIQVSEFKSWSEVAVWAQGLFKTSNYTSEAVRSQLDKLRSPNDTQERIAEKILDFVQQDIRYFATEVGVNTHLPLSPDQVLRQRFGDCKDKVNLLVALLQSAGIEAKPVLVSTSIRGDVVRLIPSAAAFNHVVAQVRLGDQIHWFDATSARQRGPLFERQAQRFERGLVVGSGATDLSVMPGGQAQWVVKVKDAITVTAVDQPVVLESVTTLFEDRAANMRNLRASMPRAALSRFLENEYRERYGVDAKLIEDPVITEVPDHNAIEVKLRLNIPDAFERSSSLFTLKPQLFRIVDALRMPSKLARQNAYVVGFTGRYAHEVSIEFPEQMWADPFGRRFEDVSEHFQVKWQLHQQAKKAFVKADLVVFSDRVEPTRLEDYRRRLSNSGARLGGLIYWNVLTPSLVEQNDAALRNILSEQIRLNRSYRYIDLARIRNLTAYIESGRLNNRLMANALAERGEAYAEDSEYVKAVSDYRASLQRRPDFGYLRLNLGRSQVLSGDIEGGLKTLTDAMADTPDNAEGRRLKAVGLYLTGQHAEAKSQFLSLLEDSPQEATSGMVHNWIRLCTIRLKEPISALSSVSISAKPKTWAYALSQFGLGQISAEELERQSKDATLKGPDVADRTLQRQLISGLSALAEGRSGAGKDLLDPVGKGRLPLEASVAKYVLKN